jgi:heme oxygenase
MILARLREQTADLHASLERTLPLGPAQFSLRQYGNVLAAFRGFFATWEAEAERRAPVALRPLVRERARLHLLDADLALLGIAPQPPISPAQLPRLEDPPTLLGSMYVLEGSRLGGQVIARYVAEMDDIRLLRGYPEQQARPREPLAAPIAFFTGFGPQTGPQWKRFCSVLQQYAVSDAASNAMVAAARRTFVAFESWMQRCSPLEAAACL